MIRRHTLGADLFNAPLSGKGELAAGGVIPKVSGEEEAGVGG